MSIKFNLPTLELQPPFTSEKFRKAAANMQAEADDTLAAIAELTAIADAMDGTTPVAVARDMTLPPSERKTVNGSTDGAHVGPPQGPTDDDGPPVEPLSAAEAFAHGWQNGVTPVSLPGMAPPVPTTTAPPPPPPVPAADAELDSKGNPWIEGVHADNKSQKQDGTWKARRGGTKSPATNRADGGPAIDDVSLPTFQAAMGKLIAAGVEINEITKSVSQTVFSDMSRESGGIEHVLAAGDAKLTGKAWSALKAIAIQTGNGSAF